MEIFDNVNKTVKDDLTVTIEKGSKLRIAAACFSLYAYQVLKKQLEQGGQSQMDKLEMKTPNLADENFATLARLFPNAVT